VLLTDAKHTGPESYPALRVGDFGMSRTMHRKIDSSLHRNLPRGTPYYEPPEARTELSTLDFSKLKHRLRESLHINEAYKHVTPAANVWAFAAIVWELMTMRNISELDDRAIACTPMFGASRKGMITDALMTPLGDDPPKYSPALVQTIRWCLQWNAADRPTVSQLESTIRRFTGPGPYRPTCDEEKLWTNDRLALHPLGAHKTPWPLDEEFWHMFWGVADFWNEKDPLLMPTNVNGRIYQYLFDSKKPVNVKQLWQQRFTGDYPPPIEHRAPEQPSIRKQQYQAYKTTPAVRPQTPKRKRYDNEFERKRVSP
jgi:serine/threonine protein kinase